MLVNVKKFHEQVASSLGAALGIGITETLINYPKYSGAAIADLEKIIPGIDSYPDDDIHRLDADRAIIAATALKLLPFWKLNYLKISQTPAIKTEKFEPDWELLELHLQSEVEEALSNIDPDYGNSTANGFVGFRITWGDRGCRNCTNT